MLLYPAVLQPLALPPRVLFGPRTSQTGALSSDSVTLRSLSNQQGHAVLHATAEAADACCGLRFARTVFFSQGALERSLAGQTSGQTLGQTLVDFEVDQQDFLDLLAWYGAAVDAAWAGMKHFATEVTSRIGNIVNLTFAALGFKWIYTSYQLFTSSACDDDVIKPFASAGVKSCCMCLYQNLHHPVPCNSSDRCYGTPQLASQVQAPTDIY